MVERSERRLTHKWSGDVAKGGWVVVVVMVVSAQLRLPVEGSFCGASGFGTMRLTIDSGRIKKVPNPLRQQEIEEGAWGRN